MKHPVRQLAHDGKGDPESGEEYLKVVYEELRRLAARMMESQPSYHTLQPTALVHEAWLKLGGSGTRWNDRAHFFRAAAEAMRRVLIDHARAKSREKRGGRLKRVDLIDIDLAVNAPPEVLLLVDEALDRFAVEHAPQAEVVKLKFFIGLTDEETADVLKLSEATVKRYWKFARAWLYGELNRIIDEE